jgi:hypothetical protein
MAAINPVDDVNPASAGAENPVAPHRSDVAAEQAAEDDRAIQRITNVPRDVGWMMISVGVLGVILPGLPGAPFLVAGAASAHTWRTAAVDAVGQAQAERRRAHQPQADQSMAR